MSRAESASQWWFALAPLVRDRPVTVACVLGAAVVCAIALPLSAALNIWIDEAFTLHSTGAGLAFAWLEAGRFELQPPLYFIFEAAWRSLDTQSIAFARFPSTIFAAAAVAVIVVAAHRITPRIPPVIVALVSATNPVVIWAATEMRVYAMVLLAGAVLTATFYSGFLLDDRSRRAQIIYTICAILGLYTQYYIGFVLVAHAATLVLVRRSAIRPFAVCAIVAGAAFVPFVKTALDQVEQSGGFVRHASIFAVVHEIAVNVLVYALPHDPSWHGAIKLTGVALTLALVALIAYGRPGVTERAKRGLILQLALCLAIFGALFLVSGFPGFTQRHIIVTAPASMLVAYVVLSSMARARDVILRVALGAFAAFAVLTFWMQYRPPLAKTGDWQRVALALRREPTIPVAIFTADLAVPLGVYRSQPIVSIPRPMRFDPQYLSEMAVHSEADIAAVLDPLHARTDRLWVVTRVLCPPDAPADYEYDCGLLRDYLARRYRVLETIAFRGAFAQLYLRRP